MADQRPRLVRVRARYDRAARQTAAATADRPGLVARAQTQGYSEADLDALPTEALAGLGCGNPAALAGLRAGETVLDLGCGGGLDALIAARRVGPAGRVIGVDLAPAMVRKAAATARQAGLTQAEFRVGHLEKLPVDSATIDVAISNCVLNYADDKPAAARELFRVLKPGGRALIADLVTSAPVSVATRWRVSAELREWLEGAADRQTYLAALRAAGFRRIAILADTVYQGPGLEPGLAGKIVSLQLRVVRPRQRALRPGARRVPRPGGAGPADRAADGRGRSDP